MNNLCSYDEVVRSTKGTPQRINGSLIVINGEQRNTMAFNGAGTYIFGAVAPTPLHKPAKSSTFVAQFTSDRVTNTMNLQRLTKAQVKWVRSLQNKKVRDELGLFVAEGDKCVSDLRTAFPLQLLVTPDNATPTEIQQMSSLRTPQGVIGVFRKERITPLSDSHSDLILSLDGIQDPGNMGTILRTCDWFGVRHVYCSRDTADCFNPKVVQATMGALSRVQVDYVNLPEVLTQYRASGSPIYGTLLNGRNMYEPHAIASPCRGIIVMGNEGNGLSAAVRSIITHPLYIPPYPQGAPTSESLNVSIATAIVLAEFRRLQSSSL